MPFQRCRRIISFLVLIPSGACPLLQAPDHVLYLGKFLVGCFGLVLVWVSWCLPGLGYLCTPSRRLAACRRVADQVFVFRKWLKPWLRLHRLVHLLLEYPFSLLLFFDGAASLSSPLLIAASTPFPLVLIGIRCLR